ncbi:MAG: PEP-CTERM sorting domain-containing protein [Verrucomicrobia bacterium]|nr:PEP-CTERM sorting domain-containing protein [Verrucomicrobiota bacterium]
MLDHRPGAHVLLLARARNLPRLLPARGATHHGQRRPLGRPAPATNLLKAFDICVPEPSTWLLLGVGFALLCCLPRSCRQRGY